MDALKLGEILSGKFSGKFYVVVHIQINHDRGTEFADNRDWFRVINITGENGQPTQEYHLAEYSIDDMDVDFNR